LQIRRAEEKNLAGKFMPERVNKNTHKNFLKNVGSNTGKPEVEIKIRHPLQLVRLLILADCKFYFPNMKLS